MSDGPSGNAGDVFNVPRVRRLVELMNEHGLAEIDLQQGEQRIRLRRTATEVATAVPMPTYAPAQVAAAGSPPAAAPAAPPANEKLIRSPMVGTFYLSSSPDSAPFVKVGDQVGPETTVCIVEAMKVFNEIPAECSGRIVAVLVENGAPVEFGQPLFRVTA